MATTKTFHLPDLGEGLPDATVVEWRGRETRCTAGIDGNGEGSR
jgi:hypothetical protein